MTIDDARVEEMGRMETAFTPGPWAVEDPLDFELSIVEAGKPTHEWRFIAGCGLPDDDDDQGFTGREVRANACLIAAAPELYDGCNALLGLIQLILGRDDLSDELREVLTTNHRIAEAEAATTKALGEQLARGTA